MKFKFECLHFHEICPIYQPPYHDCTFEIIADDRQYVFNTAVAHLTGFNMPHGPDYEGYHYEDTPELRECIAASIIEIDDSK